MYLSQDPQTGLWHAVRYGTWVWSQGFESAEAVQDAARSGTLVFATKATA